MRNLRQKIVRGALWTLLGKFSCQGVSFAVGMVLARLLTPDDFGTVALTTIFFAVANVLADAGFGSALIQKKEADDLDFNSVFCLNLVLAAAVCVVLFFAAPAIARFYAAPVLVPMVRVSSVSVAFNALGAVHQAKLIRKMRFDLCFRVSLAASVASAATGLGLALAGFGVWALVWATLAASLTTLVARWLALAWRPRFVFSADRLKALFAYGWKMCVSGLLDRLFVNLNGVLIGKFYSRVDLAFVNKGNSLPELAMGQVDETLGSVSFPALAELQNDRSRLREAMRRMIRCVTFLVFPLMVGIAACSENLLRLCYGEQWVPAAHYMALAAFSFALWPVSTINLRGLHALGRSDIFLKLEIAKKAAKLAVILAFFPLGVFPFVAACAFAFGPIALAINAWPNRKLLDYSFKMQLGDALPAVVPCLAEAAVVWTVGFCFTDAPLAVELLCQLVAGALAFVLTAWFLRLGPSGRTLRSELAQLRREPFPKMADDPQSIPCIETSDAERLCARPLVSVLMLAYNHEPFIRQAIEGVLMQETDFDFEVVIGEDCSTDATREICFEYQRRHPERIRVLWWHENVSELGGNGNRVRARCRGEFIAMCEGDDCWTDPRKLQRQVDVFRSHPEVTLCCHRFLARTQKGLEDLTAERRAALYRTGKTRGGFLFERGEFLFPTLLSQTAAVMYRKSACDLAMIRRIGLVYDWILYYVILSKGPGYFIDEPMSVYCYSGGVWSTMDWLQKIRWNLSRAQRLYDVDPTAASRRQRDEWLERLRRQCSPWCELDLVRGMLGSLRRRLCEPAERRGS